MTIRKTPNDRWQAIVKSGRVQVASRTFDLRRDAEAWHASQVRALDLGEFVDPKAGKASLGSVLERWIEERKGTVSSTTLRNDRNRIKYLEGMKTRPISSIRASDLESLFGDLLRRDLSKATVKQVRALLSASLGWAARNKLISKNPALETRVPRGTGIKTHDVRPFTASELRSLAERLRPSAGAQADIALVLGLTGLRWGELCALRVQDVAKVPLLAFRVSRSASDGHQVRTTKNGRVRTVPLVPEVAKIVEDWSAGKSMGDLVFSSPGGSRLNGSNWRRLSQWSKFCDGRRIHDLRHTAATLWLGMGVDPKTVQKWMGHESMQMTVDLYGHWMGSDADSAAIARVTAALGGAPGVLDKKSGNSA
jgi:integrase